MGSSLCVIPSSQWNRLCVDPLFENNLSRNTLCGIIFVGSSLGSSLGCSVRIISVQVLSVGSSLGLSLCHALCGDPQWRSSVWILSLGSSLWDAISGLKLVDPLSGILSVDILTVYPIIFLKSSEYYTSKNNLASLYNRCLI